jgi:hypothetical protein
MMPPAKSAQHARSGGGNLQASTAAKMGEQPAFATILLPN